MDPLSLRGAETLFRARDFERRLVETDIQERSVPKKQKRRGLVWQELDSSKVKSGAFDILDWKVYRTSVPGGWLVLVIHNTNGLTFFPDPEHKWDGGSTTAV
jgi:hypothetical protein